MARGIFTPMHKILKPGARGDARLETFTISESEARLQAVLNPRGRISAGRYVRLFIGDTVWMSDTYHEQFTNYDVVLEARGDVLIAGLGIGMVLLPILKKPEVRSVTVVEKSKDVIALVQPQLPKRKLDVVHADIHTWSPPINKKWDVIYFDIWKGLCTDYLAEMATLHRRFARRKRPGGWMNSWGAEILRDMRREEQRMWP